MFSKKKRFLASVLAASLLSMQIVYADGGFEGWNEANQSDAWDVYVVTEWSEMQDDLILDQLKAKAEATGISMSVRAWEEHVKTALKEVDGGIYPATEYTELMLAMIQVLSGGNPSIDDPCNIKVYFDPTVEDMTAEKSITKLATRLFAAENAHLSQPTQASIYSMDDALKSVIQGVMYGSGYPRTVDLYTRVSSDRYYKDNQSYFDGKGVTPDVLFAEAVSSYYKTSSVSGGGVTYTGNVTEQMQRIADNARNNNSTKPCTKNYCAAWVSGVYEASGLPYIGGNAIDMWNKYKDTGSTSKNNIPPGAVVCGSGSGSAGAQYGHVGIYIGDGLIAQNIGRHDICSIDEWCRQQTATCQGKSGWFGWVYPYGFSQ